jgi:hypothetical protein
MFWLFCHPQWQAGTLRSFHVSTRGRSNCMEWQEHMTLNSDGDATSRALSSDLLGAKHFNSSPPVAGQLELNQAMS